MTFSRDGEEILSILFLLLMLAVAGITFLVKQFSPEAPSVFDQETLKPLPLTELKPDELPRKGSVVTLTQPERRFTSDHINNNISEAYPKLDEIQTVEMGNSPEHYTLTALGLDLHFHAANAFLLEYAPHSMQKEWQPMVILAANFKYVLDKDNFLGGYQEIWQTSKQVYRFLRGDCEDHAILLADWLIEMGFDAKVVVGHHQKEGHAWVVLFKDKEVYLLEATDKRPSNTYPAARFMPDYWPEYMFNRDTMWHNSGSFMTTDYAGDHWVSISRFEAA